jgi:hypothetical protein
MQYDHRGPVESVGNAPTATGPTHPGSDRRAWHAPVVTRLSVERTLFNTGSPVDGASIGSTPG